MERLTIDMLVSAANDVQVTKSYVCILISNGEIQVSTKSLQHFTRDRSTDLADPNFLKAIMPENILKYSYADWKLQECSIATLVEEINNAYCPISS